MRKSIISIVIVLSLLFGLTWNVGATFIETQINKNLSVEELADKYLTVTKIEDENGEKTVSEGIDVLKTKISASRPGISDLELAKEIYRALGDDDFAISQLPEDKIIEILDCTKCIENTDYIRANENGQEYLKKNELVKELANLNDLTYDGEIFVENNGSVIGNTSVAYSAASNDYYNETNSSDGYMQLKTKALYLSSMSASDPKREYYHIQVDARWLKMPYWSLEDLLVLFGDGNYFDEYEVFGSVSLSYEIYDYKGNLQTSNMVTNYISDQRGSNTTSNFIALDNNAGPGAFVLRFSTSVPSAQQLKYTRKVATLYAACTFDNEDGYIQGAYSHAKIGGSISVSFPAGASFTGAIGRSDYFGKPLTIYYNGES